MNLRILGKAMGFMFLPTLGVLLMLIIGFFDPIAMWTWIKSNNGWAIATRILIFLAEIGLVTILYFDYLEKDKKQQAIDKKKGVGVRQAINYDNYIFRLWGDESKNFNFFWFQTEHPDVKIVIREERLPK